MIASLYENLPFIIFLIALAINLVVFVVGVIMSLTAKDPIKLEKGKIKNSECPGGIARYL